MAVAPGKFTAKAPPRLSKAPFTIPKCRHLPLRTSASQRKMIVLYACELAWPSEGEAGNSLLHRSTACRPQSCGPSPLLDQHLRYHSMGRTDGMHLPPASSAAREARALLQNHPSANTLITFLAVPPRATGMAEPQEWWPEPLLRLAKSYLRSPVIR